MERMENVDSLVEEYRDILGGQSTGQIESLEEILVREGEWTPQAASHLVQLARGYGTFMLKNALAISIALEIEDGELGF